MSDANPTSDPIDYDDELKVALANAFGDDAMSLLEDDSDELSDEMLAAFGIEDPANLTADPGGDDDLSPLIRYVTELNNAIYCNGELPSGPRDSTARTPRYVVFFIGKQQFGLPFHDVLEIARYPKVTALPRTPGWLRGVANLRGQILSVTDLRNLFQFANERPAVGEKIIVVRSKLHAASTAIVVDSILGIRNFGDELGKVSDFSHRVARVANGTATIDQQTTVLLDPDKLFASAELLGFEQ